ncbi:MAG: secretin N-terminal domain-containing protein, partial [Pirellulales bacterium]
AQEAAAPATTQAVEKAAGQAVPAAQPQPGRAQAGQPGQPGQPQPGQAQPGQPGQTPEGQKPAEGAKPPEGVKRPDEPPQPPDPKELDIKPDADGMLSFSFKGQPWPAVLEWLADVSDMSLHWQEAPAGYLDLTTRGRYSVEDVRDLINSVLLSKGYTLLRNGEILMVANTKTLDASLVPRVRLDELDDRGRYELVKVLFDLDWLVAEAAAEEVKPLLSPHGKVTALKNTNRLDMLDTAGNLLKIRELLSEEQSDRGQERLIRTFKLQHTRASDVEETLNTLLGLEKKESSGPMTPEQQMQAQQRAMMMAQQQQQQQQQQGGAPAGPKKEAPVYLAVNQRENAILVNAPPDKMAIIEQAILAVDVPQERSQTLLANLQRMSVYRLSGVTPDSLVRVLEELGGLDPATRLEVDANNKAIIAYAPLADHLLIRSLVDKLDGTGRTFEVIQLRRLSAEYVAGSIMMLMAGPEEDSNSRRNRYPYYFYGSYGSQQEEKAADRFQVEADIEHNRLLLRANEVELAEINDLLLKLGEIPPGARNMNTMRIIPATPGDETQDVLEQLKRLWPSISENPLEVETGGSKTRKPTRERPPAEEEEEDAEAIQPLRDARSGAGRDPVARSGAQGAQPVTAVFKLAQTVKPATPPGSDELLADAGENAADETAEPAEPAEEGSGPADEPRDADGPGRLDEAASDEVDPGQTQFDERALRPQRERVDEEAAGADDQPARRRKSPAPVKITIGPHGLVVSSTDTEALDQMEELIANIMPSRQSFKIFTLKHTYAKDVVYLLKDIFKEDDKDSSRSDMFSSWYYGYPSSDGSDKKTSSLSKRRPLKFVADSLTNTILVQGADADQLAEIEYLIELYDRVEPPDSNSVRRTQRIIFQYAEAKQAAEVIKDVFRDLLSPNDKALVGSQPQQPQKDDREGGYYRSIFSYLTEDTDESGNIPRFKGMLSIGIDERGNALVVSAPQILLADVINMAKQLDEGARPTRPVVQIKRLRQPGTASQIQQAFGTPKAGPATPASPPPAGPNGRNGPNGRDGQQPAQTNGGATAAVPSG